MAASAPPESAVTRSRGTEMRALGAHVQHQRGVRMAGGYVLVVGGSGYLGQFVSEHLHEIGHEVVYTYCSRKVATSALDGVFVDLMTGEGFDEIDSRFGEPAAVINCAAVSQPRACEENLERARAINVPRKLVEWLTRTFAKRPLLVQFSTDHCYAGNKAFWREGDPCEPRNAYGATKVEAEQYLASHYPGCVVLRSSIIYGPEPSQAIGRSLFLQWMKSVIDPVSGEGTVDFFSDEYRSPVYVRDIAALVGKLVASYGGGDLAGRRSRSTAASPSLAGKLEIYNLGGPDRLSRYDMALLLASAMDWPTSSIGHSMRPLQMKAPLDASMDITHTRGTLGFEPTPFATALKEIFHVSH